MSVSKGRNMIQSDIDMKYEVLRAMIDELPTFVGKIVGDVEKSKKAEAKYVAQGDKEIETDVAIHHPLNEYEDVFVAMNPYIYQAMIGMIYSYAESTLAQFNSHDKLPKGNAPEIVKIISVLQRKYNIKERKVKKIKYYWKGFDEFRELRNHLVHEWANSKNPNKEWIFNPQKYLKDNLDIVYAMLREIMRMLTSSIMTTRKRLKKIDHHSHH